MGWNLEGYWHAICIFFGCFYLNSEMITQNEGHPWDMWDVGNACFTVNVIIVTLRLAMDTMNWTCVHWVFYVGSVGVWFFFILFYTAQGPDSPSFYSPNIYMSMWHLVAESHFWLLQLVTVVWALLPTMVFYGYK